MSGEPLESPQVNADVIESAVMSRPAKRILTKSDTFQEKRESARQAAAERSSRSGTGAAPGVSEQQILQLHALQNDRLHQLGQSMPLQERLHCLQKGHCLSIYQYAARKSSIVRWGTDEEKSFNHDEASMHDAGAAAGGIAAPTSESEFRDSVQVRFNLFVDQYTIYVESPSDVVAPLCVCGLPCALRQQTDELFAGMCLWVCAGGRCTALEEAGFLQDGVFSPLDPVDGTVVANSSSCAEDPNVSMDDLERRMDELEDLRVNDPSAWWDLLLSSSIVLDSVAETTLTQNIAVPECECGKPAQTIVEKVTGELFGICRDRACFFVDVYEEENLPKIRNMDIGQYLQFGASTIDRYTTLQYTMRWFGYTFSKPFWTFLGDRPADADYPNGSFQIEPGEEYTGFLSYRGGSGRLVIQSTLCAEFNIAPTTFFVVIPCSVLAVCLSQIPNVCAGSNASTWD